MEFHCALFSERNTPAVKRDQHRLIDALQRHLARMGVACGQQRLPPTTAGREAQSGLLTIAAHEVRIVVKRLPLVAERIVEALALHHARHALGARPATLLVVHLERLPNGAERWLDEVARIQGVTRAPANWAVLSSAGGAIIQLPLARRARATVPDDALAEAAKAADAAPHHLTDIHASDVAMAILKIALLRSAPADRVDWKVLGAWPAGGQRHQLTDLTRITTIAAMAEHLAVSKSAIYTVHQALARRGWIVAKRGQLAEIADIPAVVSWWIDQRKHRQVRTIPVAPLYEAPALSHKSALTWLRGRFQADGGPWAVSGWAACQLHRRLVLNDPVGKPLVVVVRGPASRVRQAWSLADVPAERALFHLQSSPTPAATFAMATDVRGLPCVDLWEAALDVASDPQRGIEQTRAIADALFPSGP
jgi:hypothetical protein